MGTIAKPFGEIFNFPQAAALRENRRKFGGVKKQWQEAGDLSSRLWRAVLAFVFLAVLVAIVWNPWAGVFMLVALTAISAVQAIWMWRNRKFYQRHTAKFADDCHNFKAVVAVIRLDWLTGSPYFVAIATRTGELRWDILETADSKYLYYWLTNLGAQSTLYPELLLEFADSRITAKAKWLELLDALSDFGFGSFLDRKFLLAEALRDYRKGEGD